MSKEQPTKISIDPTSIINLKAELLKKQEEFRQKKLAQNTSVENEYETSKTTSTWGKKKLKAKEETEKKAETEANIEPVETEEDVLKKSRKMLESKARYYEQVTRGQKLPEEGDEEIFLVNFDQKIVETKVETEIEKEKLRLKAEISEEDYNEQLRRKWEKEKYENLEKTNIRYEDIRYDEIRNLGVGNFRFSKDEAERQKEMEFFKDLHLETQTNRIQNEIYNLKREKSLKERLNKVKQRRFLKHGYSIAEIKEMCPYDKEIEEIDEEIKQLEELIKNPELIKAKQEQKDSQEEGEEFDKTRMKKKIYFDREWDKPKLKEKFWEKHVQKLRSERQKQFAPPVSYDKNKQAKKSKKKKAKETTNQEAESSKPESSFQSSSDQFSFFYPPPPDSFIPFPNFNIPPPNFPMNNFQNQQNNS